MYIYLWVHKTFVFNWMFLRACSGLPQKANVHIYQILPSMTCVFADLYIPGLLYSHSMGFLFQLSIVGALYLTCD